MATHKFGGAWTTEKLERVRKYLCAYTSIFTRNPKARYFRTTYVDAFAGTGQRSDSAVEDERSRMLLAPSDYDADTEAFKKGSVRIALEVEPPFDHYVFIERDAQRARDLHELMGKFPEKKRRITVREGEANEFLQEWSQETAWQRQRAVVFLDPYGMQVDWTTLEAIAKTQAIDLWLLFPLGVAVNRLLTKEEPPTPWAKALTRIFGTGDWKTAFYPPRTEHTLFGDEVTQRKEADADAIAAFFLERLKGIFAKVADNPRPLYNSGGTLIYLLCFAAGNPKGAKTAVKIAQDILKR